MGVLSTCPFSLLSLPLSGLCGPPTSRPPTLTILPAIAFRLPHKLSIKQIRLNKKRICFYFCPQSAVFNDTFPSNLVILSLTLAQPRFRFVLNTFGMFSCSVHPFGVYKRLIPKFLCGKNHRTLHSIFSSFYFWTRASFNSHPHFL